MDNQVRSLQENPAGATISLTSVKSAAVNPKAMEDALLYSNNNLGTLEQGLGSHYSILKHSPRI